MPLFQLTEASERSHDWQRAMSMLEQMQACKMGFRIAVHHSSTERERVRERERERVA